MSAKPEQEKIQQLQLLEQANQNLMMQKQNFQSQLIEADSAADELSKTDSAYKIVGSIMVAANKDELLEELKKKQEILNLRIKTIEKQETQLKEKAMKLQEEVLSSMKSGHKHSEGCGCDDEDCKHSK